MYFIARFQFPARHCLVVFATIAVAMSGCRQTGPVELAQQPAAEQVALPSPNGADKNDQLAQTVSQLRNLVDEAKQQMDQQDWDGAIEKYTLALQHRWPDSADKKKINLQHAEVFLLRGQAFLAKQLPQVAIEDFSDAIAFGDYDLKAKAYIERARAHSKLEQWSQATADCNQAIRLVPKNGEAFLIDSRALAELGRPDQARISLLEAERLGIHTTWKIPLPESTLTVVEQAQSSLNQRQPLVAIEILETAQLEGNGTWQSNGLLARTLLEMHEADRAIVASSNALQQNPQYADAYRIRGLSRLQQESFDRAIADFTAAIALDVSLSEPLMPYLTEAQSRGGIHPEIRVAALRQIKQLATAESESPLPESESEQWLVELFQMPNSSDQIEHFRILMAATPESQLDSLNWLADFLMLDLRVPAVNAIRTWLAGKSPDMPPTAVGLWERVASRKAAATNRVNLYPDVAAFAIDHEFDRVLRTCIDLGICNLNIDHMYRAVVRKDSRCLRMILPYAVLADRELTGLLKYCVENDKRQDVLLIINQHERSLTYQLLEYLGLNKQLAGT
jgi:tetratricopeptide (TPR) repeat protein